MKKLFYQVLPILLILSIGLTSCQKPADDENQSEAFKKYGQEFKGRLQNLIKIPRSGGLHHLSLQKEHRM